LRDIGRIASVITSVARVLNSWQVVVELV
jgi:hypothetical protein